MLFSNKIKSHIEWLEGDNLRVRKFLAVIMVYIWIMTLILTTILFIFEISILEIFGIVTAQFATVIIFYMSTKASSDNPQNKV